MLVKFLTGTIVGGIVLYLTGFLVFGILLAEYSKANMAQYPGLMKDPPEHISLFLFNLVYAGLLTLVFVKWGGIKNVVSGMSAGAMIMFLVALGNDLQYIAFMNFFTGFAPAAVDVIATTALGAIMGGAIGFVLGKLDKPAEAAEA